MQELEKILEEIIEQLKAEGCIIDDAAGNRAEEIVRQHMNDNSICADCSRRKWYQIGFKDGLKSNDGWIPVEERMPTQEECEDNWFWIAYGDSFGNSPIVARCEWVFADDEDGNDDSGPEFYIDQFPFPYKPSKNLIKAWKIIDIPSPYRPERNE